MGFLLREHTKQSRLHHLGFWQFPSEPVIETQLESSGQNPILTLVSHTETILQDDFRKSSPLPTKHRFPTASLTSEHPIHALVHDNPMR